MCVCVLPLDSEAHIDDDAQSFNERVDVHGLDALALIVNDRYQAVYLGLFELLKPVADILGVLQADSSPTLPIVQLAYWVLDTKCTDARNELQNRMHSSDTLRRVITELQKQLQQRFAYDPLPLDDDYIPVDYIASALDPRTKDLIFLPEDEHEFVWNEIVKLIPNGLLSTSRMRSNILLSIKRI